MAGIAATGYGTGVAPYTGPKPSAMPSPVANSPQDPYASLQYASLHNLPAYMDPMAPPQPSTYNYATQQQQLPGQSTTQRINTRGANGENVVSTQRFDPRTGMYQETGNQTGRTPLSILEELMGKANMSGFSIPGGVLPPRIGHIAPPDPANRAAAEAAQFGRAKDAAGRTGRASANNLADEMSSRGMGGSGAEVATTGNILRTAQGQMGEANREQAINALARQGQVEDRNYAGDLNQREGDIGQRGQDIGFTVQEQQNQIAAEQARRSLILSMFPSLAQLY